MHKFKDQCVPALCAGVLGIADKAVGDMKLEDRVGVDEIMGKLLDIWSEIKQRFASGWLHQLLLAVCDQDEATELSSPDKASLSRTRIQSAKAGETIASAGCLDDMSGLYMKRLIEVFTSKMSDDGLALGQDKKTPLARVVPVLASSGIAILDSPADNVFRTMINQIWCTYTCNI